RRQVLVQIAEMVLAELPGGVAERFERRGKGARFIRNTDIGAGLADGGQAGAERDFSGDEIGAAGSAACFRVVVGKPHAISGELVEVWRLAGHDALMIDADIKPTYVVAHDDEDIGLASRRGLLRLRNGLLNAGTKR